MCFQKRMLLNALNRRGTPRLTNVAAAGKEIAPTLSAKDQVRVCFWLLNVGVFLNCVWFLRLQKEIEAQDAADNALAARMATHRLQTHVLLTMGELPFVPSNAAGGPAANANTLSASGSTDAEQLQALLQSAAADARGSMRGGGGAAASPGASPRSDADSEASSVSHG